MSRFVILMHEDDWAWSRLPEVERTRLMEFYLDWVKDLKARGVFLGGEPLGDGGKVLRARDRTIEISPYQDRRHVLTGYFLIQAADLEAAAEIARECPALLHGETIVVRPVGHG